MMILETQKSAKHAADLEFKAAARAKAAYTRVHLEKVHSTVLVYSRIQLTTPSLDQTKEELEGELQTLARADLMRRRIALANPANRIIQVLCCSPPCALTDMHAAPRPGVC